MKKHPTLADIAEMKARGYDSATIAEAERRMNRKENAERVCRAIEEAFAGVTLGAGTGLKEARAQDDWADARTRAAHRAEDETHDWSNIPSESLRLYHDTFAFFDAEGMRFHLPAFLIADLREEGDYNLVSMLTLLSDHRIAQFALLSPAQRAAVRAYLLHMADGPDLGFFQSALDHALESYWIEP